jgi:hypothetical protein
MPHLVNPLADKIAVLLDDEVRSADRETWMRVFETVGFAWPVERPGDVRALVS